MGGGGVFVVPSGVLSVVPGGASFLGGGVRLGEG